MKDPKGVRVVSTDVDSGAILGERTIRNDYCLVTHGAVYVDWIERYSNGTTVLTLKRRPTPTPTPTPTPEDTP